MNGYVAPEWLYRKGRLELGGRAGKEFGSLCPEGFMSIGTGM